MDNIASSAEILRLFSERNILKHFRKFKQSLWSFGSIFLDTAKTKKNITMVRRMYKECKTNGINVSDVDKNKKHEIKIIVKEKNEDLKQINTRTLLIKIFSLHFLE